MIGFRSLVGIAVALCQLSLCHSAVLAEPVLEMKSKDWKYLDAGEAPGKDWMKADFDDSPWKSGQAPFGYGDDDIQPNISFGDDPANKRLCYFFRCVVEIEEPSAAKQFHGQLICDDGCAIYFNGVEVHRHNLPAGELSDTTLALLPVSGSTERYKFTFLADPDKLKKGRNVIAIRLHQGSKQSSDLAFDLSLAPLSLDDEVAAANEKQKREKEAIDRAIEEFKNESP